MSFCLCEAYSFDFSKCSLFRGVFSDDFVCLEIDVYTGISYANNDIIETHEETDEKQHALLMHTDLGAVDGHTVIIQFAFEENHLVEEQHGVSTLEQLDRYRLGRGFELVLRGCVLWLLDSSVICGGVAPIIGFDDLFNLLRGIFTSTFPVSRVRHFQHMLVCLVDGIESGGGCECDGPAGGEVGDGNEVVAKDHFGHGDADLVGEGIDGAGFRNGQLASRDAEVVLDVGLGSCGEGLRGEEGLVESCDVVHCGRRGW